MNVELSSYPASSVRVKPDGKTYAMGKEEEEEEDRAQGSMATLNSSKFAIGLPNLPGDVFVLILGYLEALDMVRCQMVSTAWRSAFTGPEFLRLAMKKYPLAREIREMNSEGVLPGAGRDFPWEEAFGRIACRYFHLTQGRPRRISKYKTAIPGATGMAHWYPVSPWDYHKSQPTGRLCYQNPYHPTPNYLFGHTFWCYEDGILVLPLAKLSLFDCDAATDCPAKSLRKPAIVVVDVERERGVQVPFDVQNKIVRNLRLSHRTLIIEWAEMDPYHALNNSENVHRHFASCYDIKPQSGSADSKCCRWAVEFRSEWKLHSLGLPLNQRDRFFSTHTERHYAVYFWRPDRSMYTGDEEQPLESLCVWDISQPSQYIPSADPSGKNSPPDQQAGPHVVRKFNYHDLENFGIRQQSSPSLMKLSLDSEKHTFSIRENVCVAGQGYFDPAERVWCATTTTLSFRDHGPHLKQKGTGNLPPYRGNGSMETSDVLNPEPGILGIMDVFDEGAAVRFSLAENVFTGRDMPNTAFVRIWAVGKESKLDDSIARQVAYMGRITGDERVLIGENDSQEVVVLRFD